MVSTSMEDFNFRMRFTWVRDIDFRGQRQDLVRLIAI